MSGSNPFSWKLIGIVLIAMVLSVNLQGPVFAGMTEPSDLPAVVASDSFLHAQASIGSPSQCKEMPLLMAEGSNSCEIVSCGMGIKDTCKITCPAEKTPKCSCDCLKSFGPMCTEYKANCRCE